MEIFDDIGYLQHGNAAQKSAYGTLSRYHIMDLLKYYDPLLTGTVPIAVNIESSDLDIICCYHNQDSFAGHITELFNELKNFELIVKSSAVVANFTVDNCQIEIYGEAKPTRMQHAYRHMLIEHRLLQIHGDDLRTRVICLKKAGYKTEPAFAIALGLTGDPYRALLDLEL